MTCAASKTSKAPTRVALLCILILWPLCFQPFPIDKVELHANDCQGSFAVVEENSIGICSNDGEFLGKKIITLHW